MLIKFGLFWKVKIKKKKLYREDMKLKVSSLWENTENSPMDKSSLGRKF